jgi:hypothetical protein
MKKWYEKAEYKNFVPKTEEEKWYRFWDKFQETIARFGYDNSMGTWNYLMTRFVVEHYPNMSEEAFVETIQKYLDETRE